MARGKTKTETPAALKLKTCSKNVRREGQIEKCGKQYLGADTNCPNRDVHLLAFPTGFCNSGWHEGTRATDWRGKSAPTCNFYRTCPCQCHADLDKLFKLTERERILVNSSGYVPDSGGFVLPDRWDGDALSSSSAITTLDGPESPVPVPVAPPIDRTFAATPTGRAARGQLEAWVKKQTDIWVVEEYDFACTPAYLATEIGRDEGITPPSVGAISSVFERWVKLGFAVIEKKPTRFVRYTEEGIRLGLERMKDRAKREEQMRRAAQRRGSLR